MQEKIIVTKEDNKLLMYNSYEIPIRNVISYYEKKCISSKYEILPLVYITRYSCNIFQKIVNLLCRKKRYVLEILNKVDYIEIRDCITDQSYSDDNNENLIEVQEGFVKVDLDKIQYSILLFGRCGVLIHFEKLGFITNPEFCEYAPFSVIDILRMTERNEIIKNEICKNYTCKGFINKIINNTYEFIDKNIKRDKDLNIELTFYGSSYAVGEGKHRACAFKRFGDRPILANVEKGKTYQKNSIQDSLDRAAMNNWNRRKIRWFDLKEKFYKFYADRFNLDSEKLIELYCNSSKMCFIDDFEKITGKDILSY